MGNREKTGSEIIKVTSRFPARVERKCELMRKGNE